MKFGLFGSAQARRGGSDIELGAGFSRVHRLQCRGRSARLRVDLRGRASLHRLRPGVGEPQSADLGGGAHLDPAARHRRAGAALAQSGAARRTGRDHRPAVRRAARIRRRQGLSPQRVRGLLHPDCRGRRTLRGVARADRQVVDQRSAFLASRQVLAIRGHRGRAADAAEAASADLDGGGPAGTRSARWRGAAPSCCSTSSPRPR